MDAIRIEVVPIMIKTIAKFAGIKDIEGFHKENESLITSIIEPYFINTTRAIPETEYDWGDTVAKKYYDRLTPIQRLILSVIHKNGNRATLKELVNHLKVNNHKNVTGLTIAGTLAGLSRKCQTLDIPYIYEWKWETDTEGYYCITEEAYKYLQKYLK